MLAGPHGHKRLLFVVNRLNLGSFLTRPEQGKVVFLCLGEPAALFSLIDGKRLDATDVSDQIVCRFVVQIVILKLVVVVEEVSL